MDITIRLNDEESQLLKELSEKQGVPLEITAATLLTDAIENDDYFRIENELRSQIKELWSQCRKAHAELNRSIREM